jgi:carbamate kinase
MRVVVAVGGNALIRAGQAGTWDEQLANVREIAAAVLALRGLGHEVVLTHGNGPHVGALLLQNKLGEAEAAPLPLDALIAMTQGWIGYLLESSFAELDPTVPIAVLLTRVMVDLEDAAFGAPDKPVGPFYDELEARRRAKELGWDVAPDAGRGWRRVVPSPHPLEVLGERHVRALLDQGSVVIACGGGGIPVAEQGSEVVGVAGVIDKDRCSARLAADIGADVLVLLTGVPRVALDFGTRWEREVSTLTVEEAMQGLADGDFPAGSMGPKIESAERFVTEARGRALITSADHLVSAIGGHDGTWIVPERDPGDDSPGGLASLGAIARRAILPGEVTP